MHKGWLRIICLAGQGKLFLKYELCHYFGVKCDGVRDCLVFNVSSVPPGWHPSLWVSQAEANFVAVLLPAAWQGFFVAFVYLFLFALKSLLITAWVSLCGQMRTTVKIPLKFILLGRSHKWSRIYSWIVLLYHHLLLAGNFLFIDDKAVKQHILCSGGCPYMSNFLYLTSRQERILLRRKKCAWKEAINIKMIASSSGLTS